MDSWGAWGSREAGERERCEDTVAEASLGMLGGRGREAVEGCGWNWRCEAGPGAVGRGGRGELRDEGTADDGKVKRVGGEGEGWGVVGVYQQHLAHRITGPNPVIHSLIKVDNSLHRDPGGGGEGCVCPYVKVCACACRNVCVCVCERVCEMCVVLVCLRERSGHSICH